MVCVKLLGTGGYWLADDGDDGDQTQLASLPSVVQSLLLVW